jgi:hypothetical protein
MRPQQRRLRLLQAGFACNGLGETRHTHLARMILVFSAVLAEMVFDGVTEARREAFAGHVIQPLIDRD